MAAVPRSRAEGAGAGRGRASCVDLREELVVDAPQRCEVRLVAQPLLKLRVLPWIPPRAQELAGDPCGLLREQETRQTPRQFGGIVLALNDPAACALVVGLPYDLGA